MSITIVPLTDQDRPAWDSYVQNSPHGMPMQLSAWRDILSRAYRYETYFMMAVDGGRPVGVMPLFLVRSLLVGKSLTTTPGGLCADGEQVACALLEKGREMARRLKADRLVLQDTRVPWPGDLQTSLQHVTWPVEPASCQEHLKRRVSHSVRRSVAVARENGLDVKIGCTAQMLDDFYYVLSHFTHQAGTPVFGRSFIYNVVRTFRDSVIVNVYRDREPLGSYFLLQLGKSWHGIWGSTLHAYLPLKATYLAYWEMLAEAARRGCDLVDLGRSPAGSGASQFKAQWGGTAVPVYQQVASLDKREGDVPIASRVYTDSKFQLFMRVWPRLPFSVAQYLGPKLRRHVPFA